MNRTAYVLLFSPNKALHLLLAFRACIQSLNSLRICIKSDVLLWWICSSYFLEVSREPKRVRSNKRTLLFYVSTQYPTQRPVQQVRSKSGWLQQACTACRYLHKPPSEHPDAPAILGYVDRQVVFPSQATMMSMVSNSTTSTPVSPTWPPLSA